MKKKYIYLLSFILLFAFNTTYATYFYNWSKSMGDAGINADIANSVVTDKNGNVYITGKFNGTADFDPSNAVFNLTAAGSNDNVFFAKYNSFGKFIWAKQIGDANNSSGTSIQVDDLGNVYLLVNFKSSINLDFDPDITVYNVSGQGYETVAFAKYNSNGSLVWANAISGNSDCQGRSLDMDPSGNIYIVGEFNLTIDFDPAASTANLTSTGDEYGFIAKYDNAGNFTWVKGLNGYYVDVNKIKVDYLGNFYISGYYKTNCDFDPDGVGQFLRTNDGNADFFVGRYDSNGLFLWAITLDGTKDASGNSISIDEENNVYVAGTFSDSVDMNPTTNDKFLITSGTSDQNGFVAKYSSIGDYDWAFQLGNTQTDYCYAIAVDKSGDVYVSGAFSGQVDFNPSAASALADGGTNHNGYLAQYDGDGHFISMLNLGGIAHDEVKDIFLSHEKYIYVTGYFGDTVDFDPGLDSVQQSGGTADIFMARYSTEAPLQFRKPFPASTWLLDGTYPINWKSFGIDSILIERKDSTQASNWEIMDTVSSNTHYNYYLPASNPLTAYSLRISDFTNRTVKDSSYVKIMFSPQLNYPVGGEVFTGDTIVTVNWFASNAVSAFFDLKFSINGGSNWLRMRDSVQAYYDTDSSFYIGNYNWQVPSGVNSATCQVGIFPVNVNTPLFASNDFTIQPPSPTSFQVLSPNGGESLERKRHHYLTWTGVSMPAVVVLLYSLDGSTYTIIDTVANSGYYDWRVRDTVSTNCFIKVANLSLSIFDESDAAFSIVSSQNDEAQLISPQLNDHWCVGTQQYIRWTTNIAGKITIWLKAAAGPDILIDSVKASDGMYYWTVPNLPFDHNRIRIKNLDGSGNLSTSDEFTICPNVSLLQVQSPNGGESFYPGAYIPVTWSENNAKATHLYYSLNDGVTWYLIDSALIQSPYYWLVPDSTSSTCKIKIESDSLNLIGDESDAVFTIKPLFSGITPVISTLNLSADPCKRDTFSVFYTVSSGTFDTSNTFVVQLSDSLGNFSGSFTGIGFKKDSVSGSILCTIPTTVKNSSLYSIRVLADNPPSYGTPSNAFNLISPEFTFKDSTRYTFLPSAFVTFPSIPVLPAEAIVWNFGDGTNSGLSQPTHKYTQSGIFDVRVTVTNSAGCSSSITNKGFVRVDKKFPNRALNPNKNTTVTGISFKNDSTGTIAFADGAVKFTNDYGVNWYAVQATGLTDVQAVKVKNAFEWIVVGSNGGVRKTLNRGLSWDTVTFASGLNPTVKLNAVDFSPSGSGYIAGDSGKVFRFVGGKFFAAPQFTNANLYTVFDDGTNAFVAGDSGQIVKRSAGVWTPKSSGLTTAIRSIVFASNNPDKGYAVGDMGKVIQSDDAGETWAISLAGVDINFSSIACSEMGDSAWAVGEAGIIYQTTDFGQSWERFSKGATTANTRVTFRKPRGYIAGSSGSLRIFNPVNNQLTLGISSLHEKMNLTASIFPNPAKNQFTISLPAGDSQYRKIVLKDGNGRDLFLITNEKSGSYFTKQVDISKLNAGIYFIHIEADNQYFIKKLVVLK